MINFQRSCGLKIVKDLVADDCNLSRIYGFILYTDQDPYVAKVLRDDDYWNALDSISGANWPIFAVRPLTKGSYDFPSSTDLNSIGFMVKTWNEPSRNIPVLHDFGLKDSENLPLFVAFMWDDNDELNQVAIPIKGFNVDEVYHSIEEIVKVITKAEAAVLPQYKKTVNVFRNIVTELEALQFRHMVMRRGKIAYHIFEFLSSFCNK